MMKTQTLRKLTLACATALYMLPLSAMDAPEEPGETQPTLKHEAEGVYDGMDCSTPTSLVFSMPELISYISNFCADSKTENSFFSLNRLFFMLREKQYENLNKKHNHLQWHGNPLSEYALFHFNTAFNQAFGFGINLLLPNMANDIDRTHFERLCAKIAKASFFKEDDLPLLFMKYVHNFINYKQSYWIPSAEILDEDLYNSVTDKLIDIANQKDLHKYPNEIALYLCYFKFLQKFGNSNISEQPLFEQSNGSLMIHTNQRLWDLKATPGLDNTPQFAPIWDEMISLEPGVTIWQLYNAARSHDGADNFTQAAEYYDKYIKMAIAAGQPVSSGVYSDAACSHSNADNFAKAAAYYDQYIKALNNQRCRVEAEEYAWGAITHYDAESFASAAVYYEEAIKVIINDGLTVAADEYGCAASAHFRAGNFVKAAEYRNLEIDALDDAGQAVLPPAIMQPPPFAKLGGHDEKVIEYGELWHEKKEGAYSKAELEILQHIINAYTRQGNPERAAFFANILEKNQG